MCAVSDSWIRQGVRIRETARNTEEHLVASLTDLAMETVSRGQCKKNQEAAMICLNQVVNDDAPSIFRRFLTKSLRSISIVSENFTNSSDLF